MWQRPGILGLGNHCPVVRHKLEHTRAFSEELQEHLKCWSIRSEILFEMPKYQIRNIKKRAKKPPELASKKTKYQIRNIEKKSKTKKKPPELASKKKKYQIRNIERKKQQKKTSWALELFLQVALPPLPSAPQWLPPASQWYCGQLQVVVAIDGKFELSPKQMLFYILTLKKIKATFSSATLILSVARRISSIAACTVQ